MDKKVAGYVVCFVESRHKKSIAAELNKKETSQKLFSYDITIFLAQMSSL